MKNTNQELERARATGQAGPVLAGLLIGGLAGAGAMLLLAPKSGEELRSDLREKTAELRARASGSVDGALEEVRSTTERISAEARGKADQLQRQGRELLAEQLEHVAAAAEAGKAAVQGS